MKIFERLYIFKDDNKEFDCVNFCRMVDKTKYPWEATSYLPFSHKDDLKDKHFDEIVYE